MTTVRNLPAQPKPLAATDSYLPSGSSHAQGQDSSPCSRSQISVQSSAVTVTECIVLKKLPTKGALVFTICSKAQVTEARRRSIARCQRDQQDSQLLVQVVSACTACCRPSSPVSFTASVLQGRFLYDVRGPLECLSEKIKRDLAQGGS